VPSTVHAALPDEGAPGERTVVRILYDDDALYGRRLRTGALACRQAPHAPRHAEPSDGVWLDIDSRRDGLSAFHFSRTPPALGDAIHFNDLDYSSDWTPWGRAAPPIRRAVLRRVPHPAHVLRFEALPVQDWAFRSALRRGAGEDGRLGLLPRSAGNYVPLFGRLDDLTNLQPRRSLQLLPFVLGQVRHRAPAASAGAGTLASGTDAAASAGLDVKTSVTNELALDLTFNPDFGQVEADTVVLNLSTFETFFPEKRPFFVEGSNNFRRRARSVHAAHRPPARPITLGVSDVLVDTAEPSTIYAPASSWDRGWPHDHWRDLRVHGAQRRGRAGQGGSTDARAPADPHGRASVGLQRRALEAPRDPRRVGGRAGDGDEPLRAHLRAQPGLQRHAGAPAGGGRCTNDATP
jgi:hypothetical protein